MKEILGKCEYDEERNGRYKKKKTLMKILEIESAIYKINSRLGTTEERIWKTIQTVQNLNYVTQSNIIEK